MVFSEVSVAQHSRGECELETPMVTKPSLQLQTPHRAGASPHMWTPVWADEGFTWVFLCAHLSPAASVALGWS